MHEKHCNICYLFRCSKITWFTIKGHGTGSLLVWTYQTYDGRNWSELLIVWANSLHDNAMAAQNRPDYEGEDIKVGIRAGDDWNEALFNGEVWNYMMSRYFCTTLIYEIWKTQADGLKCLHDVIYCKVRNLSNVQGKELNPFQSFGWLRALYMHCTKVVRLPLKYQWSIVSEGAKLDVDSFKGMVCRKWGCLNLHLFWELI